jgi:hypothetical protein
MSMPTLLLRRWLLFLLQQDLLLQLMLLLLLLLLLCVVQSEVRARLTTSWNLLLNTWPCVTLCCGRRL